MEFDLETAKLVTLFTIVNMISAAVGLAAVMALGILPGLVVFTLLLFLLPIPTQYVFLKKET